MPYAPLRRTMIPLGRVFGVTPWWLAGGVSAANCVAAYAPKGAASYAASKTNLANPGTYDATEGVAPTWATGTGWTFNGTTQYLKTGVVPASGWSAIISFSSATSYVFGEISNSASFAIHPQRAGGLTWYWSGSSPLQVAPNVATAVLAIAGNKAYRNGTVETGDIPAWTGTTTTDIYIAGYHDSALGSQGRTSGNIPAFAVYNTTLSAAQIAALTTAMNAL